MILKLFQNKKSKTPKEIEIPCVEYQFSESDFNSGYFNGRNKYSSQQCIEHWPKVTLKEEK